MPSLHPSTVLGAFLDALLSGKRVAVLGDSTVGLAPRLAAASPRKVCAFDPDAKRTAAAMAEASRSDGAQVSFIVLDGDLEGHLRSFDVVIVPDVASFGDPRGAIATAHELVTGRGVAVFAAQVSSEDDCDGDGSTRAHGAVDSALGYYDFYDAVAGEFSSVRMLGRAPFFGFTVADFAAEGEPAVSIDSTLIEASEPPDLYVAVASQRPVELDSYTLVQVPLADGLRWLHHEAADSHQPEQAAELAGAQLRIAEMTRELEQLHEKQRREARLAEQRRAVATAASTRAAELEAAVDERHAEARRAERRVSELERALSQQERRDAEREQEVTAARRRQTELERALSQRERQEAEREEAIAAARRRQTELEQQLRDREAREAELEGALASIAEREAELESQLAEQLSAAPAEQPSSPPAEPADGEALRANEFQLAELRKSLAATRNERDAMQPRAARAEQLEQELQVAQAGREQAETELARLSGSELALPEADAHGEEIERLERSLLERGRLVSELEAQAREAQRVGRELVRQLESAQHSAAVAAPSQAAGAAAQEAGAGGSEDRSPAADAEPASGASSSTAADESSRCAQLQLEIELLAQKCTAYQADLEAASWTIQGLRTQPPAPADESSAEVAKLEEALGAARREVAQLRAQLRAGPQDRGHDDRTTDRGPS